MSFDRAELGESIPARFDKVLRKHAGHVAIGGARPWTYGDVERRTNQLARAILDRTQPGRGCVAYLVDHSPDMVICALAALKAAKAFLCIHPGMPPKAQHDIVSDAAPDLLLADAAHATAARGLVDELTDGPGLLPRAVAAAEALAALSPPAFAQTKQQVRQPVVDAMERHGSRVAAAAEDIWTAPETLDRIRDYVSRTFKKI